MPAPPLYLLISLPTGISSTSDQEEAFGALRAGVSTDNGAVTPFHIPEFKIGTLEALVKHAEELDKLESTCSAVAGKVGDSLKSILDGDEEKVSQQKMVNDSKRIPCCSRDRLTSLTGLRTCSALPEFLQLEQGQVQDR